MIAFSSLRRLGTAPANDTSFDALTHLPTTLLETFVPGYSIVSKYLLDTLSFDISAIVSICLLIVTLFTGGKYISDYINDGIFEHFSSSITIESYDPLYDYILEWVAEHLTLRKAKDLVGYTEGDELDEDREDMNALSDISEYSIFNFKNWAATISPRYRPHNGFHRFTHNGRWFWFAHVQDRITGGSMGMVLYDHERIVLTTMGRSTQPIKSLLVETRDRHLFRQTSKTIIRRPSPKENRARGRQAWHRVATRPSRPMATVVLEECEKEMILKDVNDFLHPRTPRWYASRGIPYRRGYLFHGPPGTGKTSLSFALAGVFGLDIYCISLSEATLTEEDLIILFNSLPRRCLVLLEDIDSAGVLRRKAEDEDEEEKEKPKKKRVKQEKAMQDPTAAAASSIAKAVAEAVKGANEASEANRRGTSLHNQGISLSGLLNAIDGVASQEGRVLVMTTNYPEKLDDALIRPGRVDLKIRFALASKQQSKELFIRMYREDLKDSTRQPRTLFDILPSMKDDEPATSTDYESEPRPKSAKMSMPGITPTMVTSGTVEKNTCTDLPTPPYTPSPRDQADNRAARDAGVLSSSTLEELATAFADALPERAFSPAELQGFLLTQKKDPVKAVMEIETWRDEQLKKKEETAHVVPYLENQDVFDTAKSSA